MITDYPPTRMEPQTFVAYFATKPNLKGALLVLWEARNRRPPALMGTFAYSEVSVALMPPMSWNTSPIGSIKRS